MAKPDPRDAVLLKIANNICAGLEPDEIDALEYIGDMSVAPQSPWQIVQRLVEDADLGGVLGELEWFEGLTRPSWPAADPEIWRAPHPVLVREAEARGAICAHILSYVRRRVGRLHERYGPRMPLPRQEGKASLEADVEALMKAIEQKAEATGVPLTRNGAVKACVTQFEGRRGIKAMAERCYDQLDRSVKRGRGRPRRQLK